MSDFCCFNTNFGFFTSKTGIILTIFLDFLKITPNVQIKLRNWIETIDWEVFYLISSGKK